MRYLISLLCCLALVSGCTPQNVTEEVDPTAVCDLCDCDCACECPAPTKMEDLDFFGVYYSSCVEYLTELKEVYNACDDTETIPDVETCAWKLWNEGMTNGGPYSGCVARLREVAEIKMLPPAEWCDRLIPERVLCEHGIRP